MAAYLGGTVSTIVWIILVLVILVAIAIVVIQQRRRAGGVITGTKPARKEQGQ